MKSGGGNAKGAKYERLMCKLLSLWITHGDSGNILWRTAMSGGRSTVQAKSNVLNTAQAGDICAVDPRGAPFISRFCIECKAYTNAHIKSLLFGKPVKGSIVAFWRQALFEADRVGKSPFLVVRQNNIPDLLFLKADSKEYKLLCEQSDTLGVFPRYNVSMFYLNDFLESVDHDTFIFRLNSGDC